MSLYEALDLVVKTFGIFFIVRALYGDEPWDDDDVRPA